MSASNLTSTIGLSQYISTDKPTYLTDYNGDMLKIDNAIASDRDGISTAQNKANTADGKADANKTSIDTLNAQINGDPLDPSDSGLAGKVNGIEGNVNTINALLGNGSPTTSDQTVIGAINNLEGTIAPSEDNNTLGANYDAGKKFMRGGTLYEALVDLTSGTAFSALTLNTDYKVADRLVKQLDDAASDIALLKQEVGNGYKLLVIEYEVATVTADGVKTIAELYKELADGVVSAAQALTDDEVIICDGYDEQNFGYVSLRSPYVLFNNTTVFASGWILPYPTINGTEVRETMWRAAINNDLSICARFVANVILTIGTSTISMTGNAETTNVPANGTKISIKGSKYIKTIEH